jgi:hypothetical protein
MRTHHWIATGLALLAACATTPTPFEAKSPASLDARLAPDSDVTSALSADPPLPGQPSEAWTGLRDSPDAGVEHHHAH